jgi:hypothetical protein
MTSSTSSTSSTGSTGGGGGTFGPIYPDRVDLPFAVAENVDSDAPVKPPLLDLPALNPQTFGSFRWSRKLLAWEVLGEFASSTDWQTAAALPAFQWQGLGINAAQEKTTLFEYATDQRADALAEIIAQDGSVAQEFRHLLGITEASHPNMCQLLYIADLVATLVVLVVKKREDRPRPSQLYPALRPALPVPGHASFPSGHATQAFLMCHCVLMAINASGVLVAEEKDHWSAVLLTLADRIARNREIAGLHYPSDSAAGRALADELIELLDGLESFDDTVAYATAEWDRLA